MKFGCVFGSMVKPKDMASTTMPAGLVIREIGTKISKMDTARKNGLMAQAMKVSIIALKNRVTAYFTGLMAQSI